MTRFTFALLFVALMGLVCAAPVNTAGHVESVRQIDSAGPGESDRTNESVGRIKSVGPVQTDSHIESAGRQECPTRCVTFCPHHDESSEVDCKPMCFSFC